MDNAIKAKVRQLISQWTDVGRQRASTVIVHVMCMYTSTSSHTSMYCKYLHATRKRDVYISVCMYVCVCVCVRARARVWCGKERPPSCVFHSAAAGPAPRVSSVGKHPNIQTAAAGPQTTGTGVYWLNTFSLLVKYFQ